MRDNVSDIDIVLASISGDHLAEAEFRRRIMAPDSTMLAEMGKCFDLYREQVRQEPT